MHALLDLIRENPAQVQAFGGMVPSLLQSAASRLRILDRAVGDKALIQALDVLLPFKLRIENMAVTVLAERMAKRALSGPV